MIFPVEQFSEFPDSRDLFSQFECVLVSGPFGNKECLKADQTAFKAGLHERRRVVRASAHGD